MYTGGPAVGFYSQIEWLLGRMLCNWMGDDGTLKVLDDRVPIYPILGSFLYFGALTAPITFTLYQTWPRPPTVIFDFGIVPSIAFSVILPYWYPS